MGWLRGGGGGGGAEHAKRGRGLHGGIFGKENWMGKGVGFWKGPVLVFICDRALLLILLGRASH